MNISDRRDRVWGSVDRALNLIRPQSTTDPDGVQEPFLADADGRRPIPQRPQVSDVIHITLYDNHACPLI